MTEKSKWVATLAFSSAMGAVVDGPVEIVVVCVSVAVLIFVLDRGFGE